MKSESLSKAELRTIIKAQRKGINQKLQLDTAICNRLTELDTYKKAKQILFYMALPDEVNTDSAIVSALKDGKRVAVPYCTDDNGNMDFYYINSLDDLVSGSFGIREPNIQICKKVLDFSCSIIIVPALCFDKRGYRLGYGKGYYDRFLEKFPLISIGLCYNSLVQNEIPIDSHDKAVDYVITDSCQLHGGKNG